MSLLIAAFAAAGCDPCYTSKLVRRDVLYDHHASISRVFSQALSDTAPAKYLTTSEERKVWEEACQKIHQKVGELVIYSSFSGDLAGQIRRTSKCRVKGGELCPGVAREARVYGDANEIGMLLAKKLIDYCEKATRRSSALSSRDLWLEGHRLRNAPMNMKEGIVSIWGAVYELDKNTIPVSCGPRAYREKPIVISGEWKESPRPNSKQDCP